MHMGKTLLVGAIISILSAIGRTFISTFSFLVYVEFGTWKSTVYLYL